MTNRMRTTATPARRATRWGLAAAALALTVGLSGCVDPGGDPSTPSPTKPSPTRTATPTPSPTPTPTPTPVPTPTPTPTPEPVDTSGPVVAACETLNANYDAGRDAWLAARDQAAAQAAEAAANDAQWEGAAAAFANFAATSYPGAESSADEINAYLDSYLALVSVCAEVGVSLTTE
ncbi:hypothetical protein SCB71_14885 [Herbiconiux sp. KACC 21604]|uniref:hypothetical protein n=1 Tax=unclassified Herbiconiux TaxID=2618217 RepID=UPI001C10C44B|nr:hypothetical protein [Herbiconiux sp. SALV-R1]WPO85498.1 hypothetical protein SCB71_14885 [Herbiconiux sp. KACC 21604]